MNLERPDYIDSRWCDDCDEEMAFVGCVPCIAQFFCDNCTYRRDFYVSNEVTQAFEEGIHSHDEFEGLQ